MFLTSIFNCGTQHQSYDVVNRVKTTNVVSFVTVIISSLYTLNYLFILQQPYVAFINLGFTLAYCVPILLNAYFLHKYAKICFFVILMVHLVVCTNIYLTKQSGFHLYFFLVPTGAFLLFNLDEHKEKIWLSIAALLLFFWCENTINANPLIALTDKENHYLYQSVVFINMIEVVAILTLFTNRIALNEANLTKQACTDALTGIYNRHHFFQQSTLFLAQSVTHKRPFTLILFDLDRFKQINDNYGHHAGDICLVEICNMVKMHLRTNDFIARIGGEEFAIVLPDTTISEASSLAERMRISIENQVMTTENDQQFYATASFGIATKDSPLIDIKQLLINADKALYHAKENGRNRIKLFDLSS